MSENGFKIWWDDELSIVRGQVFGVINEDVASGIWQTTNEMAEIHGNKLKWLIDLSQMTKATSVGRKIVVKAASHPSSYQHALIGATTFVRTVINFVVSAAGHEKTRFFTNQSDAINWLHGENRP